MPKKTKRKRGRPALPPEKGKRYPLNMRTTKVLRDSLEAAAIESGRSLAQEVEFRLEQSFLRTDIETIGLGSPNDIGFLRLMGVMFTNICHQTSAESVWTEPQAFVEAEAGFREFFNAVRKLSPDLAKDVEAYGAKAGLGKGMGKGMGSIFVGLLKTPGPEELLRLAENLQRNGAATRGRPSGRSGRTADKGRKS